jgi:hypothetical protein
MLQLTSLYHQLLYMDNTNKGFSRKKFLSWGIGISSLLAIPAFFRPAQKNKETKKVKMLTQEGKLVEVDVSAISGKKEKIKNADIHSWVKRS